MHDSDSSDSSDSNTHGESDAGALCHWTDERYLNDPRRRAMDTNATMTQKGETDEYPRESKKPFRGSSESKLAGDPSPGPSKIKRGKIRRLLLPALHLEIPSGWSPLHKQNRD